MKETKFSQVFRSGESIIAVVDGVSEQRWNIYSTIGAILALTTAFSLWWVYFDNLGGTPIVY